MNALKTQMEQFFQLTFARQFDIYSRINQLETSMVRNMPSSALGFGVTLAEHCNLQCCGCDHFSPLAEPEFANFENIKNDFERLAELFGRKVFKVNFLGGEPLLNPEITRFFYMARKIFPETFLDVITNGILLQNISEEFWTACHDNNIVIRVTKYPIPVDYERIENLAVAHGVELRYFDNKNVVKTLFKLKMDVEGLQDDRKMFLLCHRATNCIYLQNGRLYTCTVAPTVRHFDRRFGTHMADEENNSIDIYKAKSPEEILNFLAKPIPLCRYCRIAETEWGISWHHSKKTIDEWT